MKDTIVKIAAGIVVYNPDDLKRFEECLMTLKEQVERVYLFNNGNELNSFSFNQENVVLLQEDGNKGISFALNSIMKQAQKDGFKWVITMDQDSIIPEGMVEEFGKIIIENDEIGIVCPQVVDKRRAYMEIKNDPQIEELDFCITSASCTSIFAWEQIGGYDDWLFIDLVDNDFCKRLRTRNFKIIRINSLILNQEFGKIEPKGEKTQKFWIKISKILKNQNFAKFSYRKYVSSVRVYYTCRNIIYVNKKMKEYGKVGYKDNYNCNGYLGFMISFIIPSFLRAKEKGKVAKAIIQGTLAGLRSAPLRWK